MPAAQKADRFAGATSLVSSCTVIAVPASSRMCAGQMPDFPGDRMPFGSSASLMRSLKRRYAWSLNPYWSEARSMKSMWARYSP